MSQAHAWADVAEHTAARPASPDSPSPDVRELSQQSLASSNIVRLMTRRPRPVWKRAIDLTAGSLGLLLAGPLLAALAGYIKVLSPGPVLFRQQRIGKGGRPFTCFKLRTMHLDPANEAVHREYYHSLMRSSRPMTKLDSGRDKRVIRGAGMLRTMGLDELPQLFNVLRGEMSLVGPRPCLGYEAEAYEPWQRQRFDVEPGLTGLWQVSGKDLLSFDQMIRLDIDYSRRRSFGLDARILAMTVPAIVVMVTRALWRRLKPASPTANGSVSGSGAAVRKRGQTRRVGVHTAAAREG